MVTKIITDANPNIGTDALEAISAKETGCYLIADRDSGNFLSMTNSAADAVRMMVMAGFPKRNLGLFVIADLNLPKSVKGLEEFINAIINEAE